jgi:hypothetical protein
MQKNIIKICAVAIAGLFTSNAMATYITYETRHTDAGVNQSDYQASWNDQHKRPCWFRQYANTRIKLSFPSAS